MIDMCRSTASGIPSVVQFLLYHSLNCSFTEFLNVLMTLKSIGCNFPVQFAGMLMTYKSLSLSSLKIALVICPLTLKISKAGKVSPIPNSHCFALI